jgi:DNA-binding MarR family transcriptional regulator
MPGRLVSPAAQAGARAYGSRVQRGDAGAEFDMRMLIICVSLSSDGGYLSHMADQGGHRRDLAAMLQPLLRALTAAELPVLARHGISMWGYTVLSALEGTTARTQAALAQAIGADKTRIIATLDDLQRAGLITREPDPADRRARLLSITTAGHQVRTTAQAEIQATENRVLARLPPADRQAFLRSAQALSALPPGEITGPQQQ